MLDVTKVAWAQAHLHSLREKRCLFPRARGGQGRAGDACGVPEITFVFGTGVLLVSSCLTGWVHDLGPRRILRGLGPTSSSQRPDAEWRSKCGPGPSRGRCELLAPAASDEVTCLQCLVRVGDMALGALTAPSARAAHPDQPVGWGKAVEGPAVLPKGPERESGEQLFWRCLRFLEDASEAWTAHDELCWQAHLARTMRHLGLSWFMAECIDHLKQYVSESVAAQVCSLLWMEGGGVRLCLPASPAFVRPRWGGWGFRTDNCIEGLFNSALGWYLGADVSEKEVSKIMDVVTQGGRHGILAENVLSPEVLWGLNTLDTPLSETNFRETVASALGCDSDSLPGATQFCAALRDRMLQDLFVAEQGVLLGVDQSGQDRGQYAEGRQAIIPSEVTCILAPGPWPP